MRKRTAQGRRPSKIARRYDSFMERNTGRGGSTDKVRLIRPNPLNFGESELRDWYLSNGFMQNVVDGPAEDALREWISIKTNRDDDNQETGEKGLGISRLIENRLAELKVQEKLTQLVKYSRMYSRGGFLFLGVQANIPQVDEVLTKPLPGEILRLDYLNVISPEYVSILDHNMDPLSSEYHKKTFHVQGREVHPSRLLWMVNNYIDEEKRGISLVETVLDSILAQDTALWSANHILFELAVKIFKSPLVAALGPEKLAEFLAKMKATMSTQGAVALTSEEDMSRIQGQPIGDLKQIFDFVFENLSGTARMPKSRLMGQSQGVITAGQFDRLSYFDDVAKFQELRIRDVIEILISLVVKERDGDIYRALSGNTAGLDWEFEFNNLWKLGPAEKADVELKEAQRDQIYITTGVLSPSEVKSLRFKELEEFSAWKPAPLSMKTVPLLPAKPEEKKADPAAGEVPPKTGQK